MARPASAEVRAAELLAGRMPEGAVWEIGEAVQWIADALVRPDAPAVHPVRQVAALLNAQRRFEHTRLLADAWQATRPPDAAIARQGTQAMIELGALDAAEAVLQQSLQRLQQQTVADCAAEVAQHRGLLARITKQRFVRDGDPALLGEAIAAYLAPYREQPGKPYWHGINAVALLKRQQRDGGSDSLPDGASAMAMATELRRRLKQAWGRDPGDHWLAATLSEACLALDDDDAAELWLYRFLHHPKTTPFAIDSFDRQLREIWQGSTLGGVGPVLAGRLAAIIAGHLLRTQSRVQVSGEQLRDLSQQLHDDPDYLEKNFSGERGLSLDLLKRMLGSCASIGCVSNRRGERLGTGFLVAGEMLHPGWGPAPVFVTNAHVIGTEVANAIAPADALVSFEVESSSAGAPVYHAVAELLYSSPPGPLGQHCDALDATLVHLDGLAPTTPALTCAPNLPLIDAKAKAYVVGHPLGSGLQLSLHDSILLDIDDEQRLVHYRTPTDPGSSGSPVFNGSWGVIALHHGGSATTPRLHGDGAYEANEGISIAAIRRRLSG